MEGDRFVACGTLRTMQSQQRSAVSRDGRERPEERAESGIGMDWKWEMGDGMVEWNGRHRIELHRLAIERTHQRAQVESGIDG